MGPQLTAGLTAGQQQARIQTRVCPPCCQRSQPHTPLPCMCSVIQQSLQRLTLSHVPAFHSIPHLATLLQHTLTAQQPRAAPPAHSFMRVDTAPLPTGPLGGLLPPLGVLSHSPPCRPCSLLAHLMGHIIIGKVIIKS